MDYPLHHAVAWWMRELGYARTYALDYEPEVVASVKVAVLTKSTAAGLADVQRAFASSTVDGVKLFMFAIAGYTKGARAWADTAGVSLFAVRDDGTSLAAASSLAQEHMPTII